MTNRSPESFFRGNDIVPFIGVVENTEDPMQIGRVQVRAIGFHPEASDGGVPTEHLPWAYVALPTTASGMSGIGSTHGLVDGSWVFGFFQDGRDAQQPFVLASFVGAPGMTPLQKEYVGSGLGLSSMGPGGLSASFQTMAAKVVGGLGNATKFGATVGGLLSLANFLKNDDAVKTITQFMGLDSASGIPKIAQVVDAATAESIKTGAIKAATLAPGLGLNALVNLPQALLGLFTAGGATGIPQGVGGSPLSSASFGTTAKPGQEITADNITAEVKTDFDLLADSAGQNLGMITILSTGTPKTKKYTIDALQRDSNNRKQGDGAGVGAHIVIDQTGQIIKTRDFTKEGAHTQGMNSVAVGGQSMQNFGIMLIGGLAPGRGTNQTNSPINSKFYPVQLATLEKLITAFLRKFPKAVLTGQNEISGTSSPGFNVSEWGAARWPNNVNTTMGGQKKIAGSGSSTVGAATLAPTNLDTEGSGAAGDSAGDIKTTTGNKRGFQGGPSHPLPSYAAKRQSDVPAMARTNALTTGSGSSSIAAGSGGPSQQYVAKMEEPSQWAFPRAREADTLDARAIPATWQAPVAPHGGEYGQAHVVRSTEGGHHILLDDTTGRQKVEIVHSSGSMLQVQADGSGLFYVKKDSYEVVLGDKNVGVQGGFTLSVGGDYRITVKGDLVYDVTGRILINGASGMTELIRGDRSTITEGSHLFQAKKNATHRVGKDVSMQVGGKMSTAVKGSRHDVTDGNRSDTAMGESMSYTAGNKAELVLGTVATHAQNMIMQSQAEIIQVAGGNFMQSAKGKMSVISDGSLIVESKAAAKIISGSAMGITSGAALDVASAGTMHIGSGPTMHLYSGSPILTNPSLQDGADAASSVSGAATAAVEAPPAQLTREANPADSKSNLNAEQVTQGEIDAAEAMDDAGETGASPAGSIQSGGTPGSDSVFNPIQSTGVISATPSLGNHKEDACAIAQDLVGKGWSQQGASAIVGNMINESSLRPAISVVDTNSLTSGGLIQWNGPRFQALKQYSAAQGLNWQTREAQLGFLNYEARNAEKSAGMRLISASDMEQAVKASAEYERFQGYASNRQGIYTGGAWENENGNRASNALGVYNDCFGGNVQSIGAQQATGIEAYTGGGTGDGGGGGGGGGDSTTVDTGTGAIDSSQGIRGPLADKNVPAGPIQQPTVPPSSETGFPGRGGTAGGINWGMKVSEHYTLGDMAPTSKFHVGMNPTYARGNISSDTLIRNLSGVAVNVLEPMSAHLGKVNVMSGYRSLAYTLALRRRGNTGAVLNSDHQIGQAVDIKVPGLSPAFVANWVERNLPNVSGIGRYPTFTHVSFKLEGNGGQIRKWGRN